MAGCRGERAGRVFRGRRARAALLALLPLLSLSPAGPALATSQTLQRSLQNVLFAPLDLVLTPVTAGWAVARNLERSEDSRAVKVAFAGPGWLWNSGVLALASVVRELTGLLELLPGLVLIPFEADLAPLFHPAESSPALVDVETPALNIRFGIDYTAG